MLASANKAAKPIELSSSGSFPVLRIVYGNKADIDRSARSVLPQSGFPGVSARMAGTTAPMHLLWAMAAVAIGRTPG
jgi:hypothetical protein